MIQMGARNDNSPVADLWWWILFGWPYDPPEEQELLEELRIFIVIEARREYPDINYLSEKYLFKTPAEVVEHLLKKVAKQIAKYQQVEQSSRNSKDRP